MAPGNSVGSNLYLKIIATVPNPPSESWMPQDEPDLTTGHQSVIRRWINNQALDN